MRPAWFALVLFALGACGKSAEDRARDVGICADTADAARIAACLERRGWDAARADSAGAAAAAALDSLFGWQVDSTWLTDTAVHAADIARCATRRGEMAQCLRLAGWPAERATAAADSVWNLRAADHQRQVEQCVRGSAGGNIADCLMLYYKWTAERALAANDSTQKAKLTR